MITKAGTNSLEARNNIYRNPHYPLLPIVPYSPKRDYEVQKKDGTAVSKDYAFKIAVRNYMICHVLVIPAIFNAFLAIVGKLKNIKLILFTQALISLACFIGRYPVDNRYEHFRDNNPEKFYKWGFFKVVDKDNKKVDKKV